MYRLTLVVTVAIRLKAAESGYVDSATCRPCHSEIFDAYARTGMGRSFDRVSNQAEVAARPVDFFHQASGSRYTLRRGNGGELMMRHAETGVQAWVDWIVGSGNHSRTLLHTKPSGKLAELPLSWYADKGGHWAMSPGYDRRDHSGFRRDISDGCLFCHNAYPSAINRGVGTGIDCQRCHGPGEEHSRIVNPAKLPRSRRLEVCLQCHLETGSRSTPDAIRRYDRGAFSYRPGEPLSDFQIYFEPAAGPAPDAITVNGAGSGLLRSKCYQATGGAMTCVACHDPHGVRRIDANAVCANCHKSAHGGELRNCVACHMPKRRTEDAVHVVMTDHRILRRPPPGDPLAPRKERHDRYSGPVALFYPRLPGADVAIRAYLAIAQGDPRQLADAIARMPNAHAGFHFELARIEQQSGRLRGAARHYQVAIERSPDHVPAIVALAELLLSMGNSGEAKRLLSRSKAEHPDLLNALAVAEVAQGRYREAEAVLRQAVRLDDWMPITHVNLGVALEAQGDRVAAAAAYRRALALQPDLDRARQLLDTIGRNQP